MLGAADDEVAAVGFRRAGHGAHIGAGAGFGHRQAVHFFAADAGEEIFFALVAGACLQDVAGARDGVLQRHACAAEFAVQQAHGEGVQSAAAEFFGHVRRVQADFARFGDDGAAQLVVQLAALFHLRFVGIQFLLNKAARGFYQQALGFGQGEIHWRGVSGDCRILPPRAHV